MAMPKNLLSMSKDDLMKDGALALSSGEVSPDEAMQAAQKFGLDPKMAVPSGSDSNWLTNQIAPQLNPYTMQPISQADLPQMNKVAKKEDQAKAELTSKNDVSRKLTKNTNYSADEFGELYNTVQNLPDIKAQREGLQKYNDLLDMQAGKASDNGVLKGLAGLTDTWTGSKFTSMIPAESKKDSILKLRDDAQKRQQDLTKTVLDGITKLKSGSDQQGQTNQIIQTLMASQNMGGGSGEERRQQSQDAKLEKDIRTDVNKVATDFEQFNGGLDQAEAGVKTGDTRAIRQLTSLLARNIGGEKGPLTDQDVANYIPPDIATSKSQLEAYLGADNPQISPQLQQSLLKLVAASRKKAVGIYNRALERKQKGYAAGSYGHLMTPNAVGDIMFSEAKKSIPAGEEKIKVKNKDGKIGYIPEAQLQAALDSKEYTKVE